MPEKLLAIAAVIENFVTGQFQQNSVSMEESLLILKSVYTRFSEQYIHQSILQRVSFVGQEQEETAELTPVRTGTMPLEKRNLCCILLYR